jgi:hypothetical protein
VRAEELGFRAASFARRKPWRSHDPLCSQRHAASQEIEFLLNNGEKLKKRGDVISGDLPESAAKKFFEDSEKRVRKSEVADRKSTRKEAKAARGNVTLWTKDGVVTKYEIRLTGKIDIDGKVTEVVRTHIIEIKDVGTTKIDVPEKARQRLGI